MIEIIALFLVVAASATRPSFFTDGINPFFVPNGSPLYGSLGGIFLAGRHPYEYTVIGG